MAADELFAMLHTQMADFIAEQAIREAAESVEETIAVVVACLRAGMSPDRATITHARAIVDAVEIDRAALSLTAVSLAHVVTRMAQARIAGDEK